MDIYSLLRQDHQNVYALFDAIDKNSDAGEKEHLFKQLKHELDLHTQLEEELFYPELLHSQRTGDRVRHALHEHGEIKNGLMKLETTDVNDPSWNEQFVKIRTQFDDHIKEEENQLFPQARQILSKRLEEDMLARVRRRRDELTGATATAGRAKAKASQVASSTSSRMREASRHYVSDQARQAAGQVHGVAEALRQTASSLEQQGQAGVSGYLGGAADGLDRLSSSMRDGDIDAVVHKTTEFARRQPALFIGGAFAAGFLMTRFLKSSATHHEGGYEAKYSREAH